jgi:hypothetical protein
MVGVAHILQDEGEVDGEVANEVVARPPRLVQLRQTCKGNYTVWTSPFRKPQAGVINAST